MRKCSLECNAKNDPLKLYKICIRVWVQKVHKVLVSFEKFIVNFLYYLYVFRQDFDVRNSQTDAKSGYEWNSKWAFFAAICVIALIDAENRANIFIQCILLRSVNRIWVMITTFSLAWWPKWCSHSRHHPLLFKCLIFEVWLNFKLGPFLRPTDGCK